jgi:hypothetical protein
MGVVGMVTAEAVMATDVALRQDAQVDLHVAAALRHAAVVDLHAVAVAGTVAVDAANPLTSKLRPRPLQLTDWWGLSLVGIWLRRENQNNRR